MASGIYAVTNGPLKESGGTSLTVCLTLEQGGYAGVDLCSSHFSGQFMDNKITKRRKKGLGSSLGGTQSACKTASLKLSPSTKEETSNSTAGERGDANSSL